VNINYLTLTPAHSTTIQLPPPHSTTKIRPERPLYYYSCRRLTTYFITKVIWIFPILTVSNRQNSILEVLYVVYIIIIVHQKVWVNMINSSWVTVSWKISVNLVV
jgi:hypothetical protein